MRKEDYLEKYVELFKEYTDECGIPYTVELPEELILSEKGRETVSIYCNTHDTYGGVRVRSLTSSLRLRRRLNCCKPRGREGFAAEHIKSLIDKKRQPGYIYKMQSTPDGKYLGSSLLRITCTKHSNTVTGKFRDLITRTRKGEDVTGRLRCCAVELQTRTIKEWFSSIKHDRLADNGEPYDYSQVTGTHISSQDRLTIVCPVHGPKEVYAFSHLTCKLSCCKFEETGVRVTKEYLLENLKRVEPQHKYKVQISNNFRSCRVWVKCEKHGVSEVDLHSKNSASQLFRYGNFCESCTRMYYSGTEQRLVAALHKRYGEELQIVTNKHLKGHGQKRLDIYLPKYRLGIEVNGVYWHSEEKKGRNAHVEKRRILAEYGIPLLQFTDLEIEQKLPIVISMINSRMGKNKVHYARKFEVEPITPQEAKQFFSDNHVSGFIPAARYLGMRSSTGAVVCAASFGVPRFNKSAQWELLRFATLRGHTIVGALSRIVKNFLRTLEPGTTLISYADLRYGTGDAYAKSGFHLLRENPPGYGYFRALKYVSRYQCQNKNLPRLLGDAYNPSLSSRENMEQNGWRRLYDAGNLLYAIQA